MCISFSRVAAAFVVFALAFSSATSPDILFLCIASSSASQTLLPSKNGNNKGDTTRKMHTSSSHNKKTIIIKYVYTYLSVICVPSSLVCCKIIIKKHMLILLLLRYCCFLVAWRLFSIQFVDWNSRRFSLVWQGFPCKQWKGSRNYFDHEWHSSKLWLFSLSFSSLSKMFEIISKSHQCLNQDGLFARVFVNFLMSYREGIQAICLFCPFGNCYLYFIGFTSVFQIVRSVESLMTHLWRNLCRQTRWSSSGDSWKHRRDHPGKFCWPFPSWIFRCRINILT